MASRSFSDSRRFIWRFAVVLVLHFIALNAAFLYAMSWSLVRPQSVPVGIRVQFADIIFAVIAFPLSGILKLFPGFVVPGYWGYGVFALVSVVWALAIARLPIARAKAPRESNAA